MRLLILSLIIPLSGCAGAAAYNEALIPQLKPLEAGIRYETSCSELAAKVATAGLKDVGPLVALYSACEQMQSESKVIFDPQAARKVRHNALNPANLLSPLP